MARPARPPAPPSTNAPSAGGGGGGASGGSIIQQLGGGRNVAMGGGVVAVVGLVLYQKHKASKNASANSSTNNLGQTVGYIPAGYSDTAEDPMQVYTGYDQVEQQIAALQNQLNNPGTSKNPNPTPKPTPVPINGGHPPIGHPGVPVSVIPPPPAKPPAAPPPSHKPPAGGGSSDREYTVVSGDNLWNIAKRFFNGNGADWTKIYAANRGVIGGNPNLILPGERLEIPQ